MKTTSLYCMMASILLVSSCKKENDSPDPVLTIDPTEQAAAETGKVLQYNFSATTDDTSGNNLNATMMGAAGYSTDRFNRANKAISISGTTGGGGAIAMPSLYNQQINFPYSVSAWFNAAQTDSLQTILLADGRPGFYNYTGFSLQIGGDGFNKRVAFSYGDSSCACFTGRTTIYAANAVNPNTWYHVVVNVSGPGYGGMEMYLNGNKVTSAITEGNGAINRMVWLNPTVHSDINGIIGLNFNPQYSYQRFTGKVDDIRIYKKLLTADDVAALYNWRP